MKKIVAVYMPSVSVWLLVLVAVLRLRARWCLKVRATSTFSSAKWKAPSRGLLTVRGFRRVRIACSPAGRSPVFFTY